MSEAAAEKSEKAPAAPGGGNKKLLLIVVVVNVLLMGGLGYVVVSGRNQAAAPPAKAAHAAKEGEGEAEAEGEGHEEKKEEEAEEEEEGEGDKKAAKHTGKFGPLLDVGTFVANLQVPPEQNARYAKVSLSVEAFNEEAKARVEAALVPIRAEALMMFSNAKPEDVVGQDKITALGEELAKRANKLVGKKSVRKVYFSELVVQ